MGGEGHGIITVRVHDATYNLKLVSFYRYTGREICFCYNENTFTIVDVTNKAAMTLVSKTAYVNVAYTHQVGLKAQRAHTTHHNSEWAMYKLMQIAIIDIVSESKYVLKSRTLDIFLQSVG